MSAAGEIALECRFATELSELAVSWRAVKVADPRLVVLDELLAAELGLDSTWLRRSSG